MLSSNHSPKQGAVSDAVTVRRQALLVADRLVTNRMITISGGWRR